MKADPLFARIALVRSGQTALYRQIYQRVRGSVLAGKITAGMRLPSARSLSDQLGVARGTVELAYQLLASEGYTVSRGAGGTVIGSIPRKRASSSLRKSKSRLALPSFPASSPRSAAEPALFQLGVPAIDAFPRKLWARLAGRAVRDTSRADLFLHQPGGSLRLRQAIANYLHISRGIACAPDQLFITPGYQGALGLILHLLAAAGEKVWVEDPGYFGALQALRRGRAIPVPVPVDEHGIDVDAGKNKGPKAKFVLITPAHQYPLGVPLTIARRLDLLDWAAGNGAWVIEDDYDSEFRYQGRPLPALKSLDNVDRVLYIGTFSKVLFPGLRMGYLVVPRELAQLFAAGCALLHPATAPLEQRVVCEFIERGHFTRHISRMRRLYAARRGALAAALRAVCGDMLEVEHRPGGLHLLTYLRRHANDKILTSKAAARAMALVPLSMAAIEAPVRAGLVLGFANIPIDQAEKAASRLRQLFV